MQLGLFRPIINNLSRLIDLSIQADLLIRLLRCSDYCWALVLVWSQRCNQCLSRPLGSTQSTTINRSTPSGRRGDRKHQASTLTERGIEEGTPSFFFGGHWLFRQALPVAHWQKKTRLEGRQGDGEAEYTADKRYMQGCRQYGHKRHPTSWEP